MAKLYSGAFNNYEQLAGSPDAKTGTYSFQHVFDTVQADGIFGPKCNLTMSYGALSTMNHQNATGLGRGWFFKLGSYSDKSRTLTLNTGASYKVREKNSSKPWTLSTKLQAMRVVMENNGEEIRIYHKNGDTEIMEVDRSTKDASLRKFISADGRHLLFEYRTYAGYKRLVSVRNSARSLATITYNDNEGEVKVVTHPDTQYASTTVLQISSRGLLQKIQLPCSQYIQFDYDTVVIDGSTRLYPIKQVAYSTGATEDMEYGAKLYLPAHAPVRYMPAITKHIKKVATAQPLITTTFTYEEDGNNYWGNNAGTVWEDYEDDLLNLAKKYRYSSESKCGDLITKCEYNKFHQMVTKIETNGISTHKKITRYEHYSDEEEPLDAQIETYELVKNETVSHEDSSGNSPQVFVKSYEYDIWGNITKETEPSGIYAASEYYPPEGGQGCPTHPHNMAAYVKRRSHHAADKSASKVHKFTYKAVDSIGGGSAIVPSTHIFANTVKTFEYFENLPKLQGVPKSETVTIGGSKSTIKACSYEFDDDTVCITDTVTGYDGASVSTSKTLSLSTRLTKKEKDEYGVETVYTHDDLDRKVSETVAAGTPYEFKTTYSYVSEPPDPLTGRPCIGTNVIQTTSSGATVHTLHDGEHRELTVHLKDDHGTLRKVSENSYDNQGRMVYRSHLDYIMSDTDENIVEKSMSEKATYVYDSWGEQSETHHDNGTIEIIESDPVTLKTIQQVVRKDAAGNVTDNLSRTETTQNLFGSPTLMQVFSKEGGVYSTMSFAYDGFGRKTEITTRNGYTAKILKYDDFDRPVKFQQYDETVFNVTYADHSNEAIVDCISVPSLNATIGQQAYDGLSRITNRTVSGVKTQFSYEGGFDKPSRRVNARNQATLFKYIPELEMQVAQVASFAGDVPVGSWNDSSKVSDTVFTYSKKADSSRGRILNASSSATQQSYDYTPSGKIRSMTQTAGNVSKTITNQKLSLEGRRVLVEMGDRNAQFAYDDHGQVVSTNEHDIKTEMKLDNFGRLSKKLVKQYNPSTKSYDLVQTTTTTYDEHSRETKRTISIAKTGQTISIESAYDTEDKVVQRSTYFSEIGSLTETFEYDGKRRLQEYNVSKCTANSLLPCNEYGKPFQAQSFRFDGLDNITSAQTTFLGGDVDMAKFSYHATHKQVLVQIFHTLTAGENAYPQTINFQYDADGNLVSCGSSKMSYTASNRLSKMNGTTYVYDALDRLVQSNKTVRLYSGSHVVQEVDGTAITDIIRCGDIPIAEIQNGDRKFYGVDQKLSVMCVMGKDTTFGNYSSYGSGGSNARIGFNGELKDIVDKNVYHLGNGTRAYLPAICGFSSNDTFSPFLGGGVNPYRYCGGDPVNAIDPSGHISWQAILGGFVAVAALIAVPFTGGSSLAIAVGAIAGIAGVVSSGLEIGAEVAAERGNDALSKKLGFYSMVFGVTSTVLSVGQIAANAVKVARAGMAAKPAIKSASKLISADSDDLVTTGYKVRFTAARQHTLPGNTKKFAVIKSTKKGGLLSSPKSAISQKKFGPLYLRKVREPIRIMRGGQYAGMSHILSKNRVVTEVFTSGGLMGAPLMNIVSYFTKLEDHVNERGEVNEGSEPELNMLVFTAYGLPSATKQSIGAEKMLF